MATEILATGSTAANSADVTIAAASTLVVALKGNTTKSRVDIQMKDDVAAYNYIGRLTGSSQPSVLLGTGTYRFSRAACAAADACGVFSG